MVDLKKKALSILRHQFLAGVLVIVPLILTFLVLRFLFGGVDELFSPLVERILGVRIPGLGIVATLVIIYLVGLLVDNLVGSKLLKLWEYLFTRTPLVRTIYGASKQLLESLTVPEKKAFQQAVLVEYPRVGCYALGFTAKNVEIGMKGGKKALVSVFIPSTPTPFAGYVRFFSQEDIIPLDMPIELALRLVVSGGVVSPDKFTSPSE